MLEPWMNRHNARKAFDFFAFLDYDELAFGIIRSCLEFYCRVTT